jgi:hypothetical protein
MNLNPNQLKDSKKSLTSKNYIEFMIPKWLIHHAFYSDEERSYKTLRVLFGILDFRPRLFKEKRKWAGEKLEKIGHLHTPKTGGNYVSQFKNEFPHINFSHVVVRTNRGDQWCPVGLNPIHPNKIKGFYIFTTVRNPLTFFISYYHHVLGHDIYHNKNHYDYPYAVKGFDVLLNEVLNREDKWPSKKFLFPNLFDQQGNPVANFVLRTEELDKDLTKITTKFGYSIAKKERKRQAKKKGTSDSYYSEKLFNKVVQTYAREMKLFGYDGFETVEPRVNLHEFQESGLKYDYLTDKLIL